MTNCHMVVVNFVSIKNTVTKYQYLAIGRFSDTRIHLKIDISSTLCLLEIHHATLPNLNSI